MVTLRSQRRLAASVLKCGKNRVWFESETLDKIGTANSRAHIRTLVKNLVIRKRNVEVHSRFRALKRLSEKRKGRHMGIGKRRGCADARMP